MKRIYSCLSQILAITVFGCVALNAVADDEAGAPSMIEALLDGKPYVNLRYRYEFVDTQYGMPSGFAKDSTQRNTFHTVGFSLKPIPNVVLKADYRNRDNRGGSQSDEVNLGFGLVF